MVMNNIWIGLLLGLVSMVTSYVVFPLALRFAIDHHIVDNPNARKLQRVPVPVFGGVVVFTGILVGCIPLMMMYPNRMLILAVVGMAIMMLIGTWDDIDGLSVKIRFYTEILLVVGFILLTDTYIDDFHGLWGIHNISPWIGVPLSVFAGVGVMNAINLIDGVDGYSSGYGVMACTFFAIAFWVVWNPVVVYVMLIVIGALIPFFMHNVFGQKSRMFIGDGGTLMLGMLMVMVLFRAMSSHGKLDAMETVNFSVPAFVLAVLCIPVFDTIRVMTMRMLRGCSPFHPDKTHLHHLFIDMGFSHLGAALSILLINAVVVMLWFVSWRCGASIDGQFYLVVFLGFLVTFGFYKFMRVQQAGGQRSKVEGQRDSIRDLSPETAAGDVMPEGSAIWQMMGRLGRWSHKEDKRFWRVMRVMMDRPWYRFRKRV